MDQDTSIVYPGDLTSFNDLADFVDLNELPFVIDYEQKEVGKQDDQ